jgi:hypothetical protein
MKLPEELLDILSYLIRPSSSGCLLPVELLDGFVIGTLDEDRPGIVRITPQEAINALEAHNRQIRLDSIDAVLADLNANE